jgi:hypothetical protein
VPYEIGGRRGFERARRLGHVATAEDDAIRRELHNYHLPPEPDQLTVPSLCVSAEDVPGADGPAPRWTIALDGSYQDVPVRDRHPSIRVGFLQVAGVLIDLDVLLADTAGPFVDPAQVRSAVSSGLVTATIPSQTLLLRPGMTMAESWRERVFKMFVEKQIDGRSLLSLLLSIWGDPPGPSAPGAPAREVLLRRCPERIQNDCAAQDLRVPSGGGTCISCGVALWPTDVLRLGEEVAENGPNLTSLGRLVNVIEGLGIYAYLASIVVNQPRNAGNVAFVSDGSLSFHGPQAPMKTKLLDHIQHMWETLRAAEYAPFVIVGLEKSGRFVEHAHALADLINPGTLLELDDDYIREHVLGGQATKGYYGEDEFFGRRFLYRTIDGRMLLMTVPPSTGTPYGSEVATGGLELFPTLKRTLGFLDRVGTSLYPNAVIPVALAHRYAAFPLGTGSDVLRMLAQEELGVGRTESRGRPVYK